MNMKLYNKNIGKRLVISVLLFHLFTFLPLSAQTVKNIAVSQEQSYTDHISLEGDVTDKDIMVKFVFDEAANQLTVTLISHRMIFVFREDVRFKPLIKGRRLRPDQLPYVVTYEPKDQYRISKLFKTTVPKPTKKYVFHRWIDYEGLQPAPQEYAMVNDYISQTFDILKKSNSVVVRLRDVMLMNDVSKHINKRRFEIPFGRDLYTEYHVDIQRNPCFGLDEDIASAKARSPTSLTGRSTNSLSHFLDNFIFPFLPAQNCSRKRSSFSKMRRRSDILYSPIARRSSPMPKAQPE